VIALSPEDSTAVRQAIIAVKSAAIAVTTDCDTDTLRRQLTEARDAIISAGETIRRAEDNVRYRLAERPQ
jgi:hypothetical protein